MPWRSITDVWDFAGLPKKQQDEVIAAFKRKAKARFYADENFPPTAVEILRSYGARVSTASDAGLLGRSDEDHAANALRRGYILVTCDRDYLNNNRFPLIHCPAIFVFDFGSGSRRAIARSFRCLGAALAAPEFYDKWAKVDANPDSWIEHVRHQDGSTSRSRNRIHRGNLETWVEEDAA